MGLLLQEALKCLCGKNRWCYAVFWKFGHRNPSLLVWEAYHYEPGFSEISGNDRRKGHQAEDRVPILINKMMTNDQVHVLGEGMVGRAAFTGDHQWILQQNMRDGYLSAVLTDLQHQFWAGMQTIAVIPVLPHGLVQFGSTLAIVENTGFVNEVKSLFTRLGGVPDALLSSCYTEDGCEQKHGSSISVGIPISVCPVENSNPKVAMFNRSQEISLSQLSELVNRPSHSLITQPKDYNQANSASQTMSLSATTINSVSNLVQANAHQASKTDLHLEGNMESGAVGAQVIISRSDAQSNQWAYPNNSSSRLSHHLIQSGSSATGLTLMEQQNLFDVGLREPAQISLPTLNDTSTSQSRSNGGVIPYSINDSIIVSLLGRSEPPTGGNRLLTPYPVPCSRSISCGSAERDSHCPPIKGLQYYSSDTGLDPISHGNLTNNNYVLSGIPSQSHSSTSDILCEKLNKGKLIKDDLYQAHNVPPAHRNEHISRYARIPDSLRECSVASLKHDKESLRFQNSIHEDAYLQHSSGDDLFDVLGLDSKNKQLLGGWNSLFIHGTDANAKSVSVDASACIIQMNDALDFSAANDGISESGIFSETSDHLLDAVVSKVHARARQGSEDNMSCWTTLTKVSSSSVVTDAPTGEKVNMLDQKQGKLIGRPPPFAKTQITRSSSFKSGCSKDNTGECSHINSSYTSQISLLSEDFHNCKRDTSVSTAHSKRPDETGKSNRKRLRPGENPRPRPKDRQMIQDRLTELREIVPNGAKCSIDALLERTIKHMLFLQSVTKHADKLKHTGESKFISKDGGLLLKDNFAGGATWAYEVGPQSTVCPIIVEDLNPPRQMLVEMLCEEQGFFLEIADIIRGLGLTILKGVLEARNEKVWVQFTVEANRDVTRMEIFLSLVHLLEQAMKTNAAESKGTDGTGTVMAENPFHQAFIPATGPSDISLH